MPQSFVEDVAVPTRWRVWAVLNGFFVNNQKCWASNEWIGERIKAHKDSVSQAVKELEERGLIKVERTRRTRLISQVLKNPEIGGTAYQESGSTPISDRREHLSISDSNSESIKKSEDKSSHLPHRIVSDTQEVKKLKKNQVAWALREKLYDMFLKENGHYPSRNQGDYHRVVAALKKLTEKQIIDLVEDALSDGRKKTVREMLTDRSIDVYLQDS